MNDADKQLLTAAGLDVNLGLDYCLHNAALYHRLLNCFLTTHLNDSCQIRQYLSAQKLKALSPLLHRLKGAALGIGGRHLYKLALHGEVLCNTGDITALATCMDEVIESLKSILQALQQLPSIDTRANTYSLEHLADQLRNRSPLAIAAFEGLAPHQLQRLNPTQTTQLYTALYSFEFPTALAILQECL